MIQHEGKILKHLLKTSANTITEIARISEISRAQLYILGRQETIPKEYKDKLAKAGVYFKNYKPPEKTEKTLLSEYGEKASRTLLEVQNQHLTETNELQKDLIEQLKTQLKDAKEEISILKKLNDKQLKHI